MGVFEKLRERGFVPESADSRTIKLTLQIAFEQLQRDSSVGIQRVGGPGLGSNINEPIQNIDCIAIRLVFSDGRPGEITINGWADVNNHTSGLATVSTLKDRIVVEINNLISQREEEKKKEEEAPDTYDWGNWQKEEITVRWQEVLASEEQLLPRQPLLGIRDKGESDNEFGDATTNVYKEIFVKPHGKPVVELIFDYSMFGKGMSANQIKELADQIALALAMAKITKQTQAVRYP